MKSKNGWDKIYSEKGKFFEESHEYMGELLKIFRKTNVKKVLDLGCGSGRHLKFFAENGFEVWGMDNAKQGLKQARKILKENNLKVKLTNSSCYKKFPYKDNFFDAVISIQVIHHGRLKDIQKCISEIERVIKKDGTIFITVTKNKYHKNNKSEMKLIEPKTYVILSGFEKGVPHHLFSRKTLKKYFKNFKIKKIWVDKMAHYCLLGFKK